MFFLPTFFFVPLLPTFFFVLLHILPSFSLVSQSNLFKLSFRYFVFYLLSSTFYRSLFLILICYDSSQLISLISLYFLLSFTHFLNLFLFLLILSSSLTHLSLTAFLQLSLFVSFLCPYTPLNSQFFQLIGYIIQLQPQPLLSSLSPRPLPLSLSVGVATK